MMENLDYQTYAELLAKNARKASAAIRTLNNETKNNVLKSVAKKIRENVSEILDENKKDIELNKNTLSAAMLDRLTLNESRIESIAKGVEEISSFESPLGKILEKRVLSNGVEISRVSVPIGSVFFIYESRPNVTIDGASLCFKAGNAVILRGGKESIHSSLYLASLFKAALKEWNVDENAVQLVNTPDRNVLSALLQKNESIDLVIPRGGEGLIRAVVEQSKIPVIKHFNGICHIYVDKSANTEMAARIVDNAKTSRPGTCNALETLLLDSSLSLEAIEKILKPLREKHVEFFGDTFTASEIQGVQALESLENYHTEYLALKMNIRIVDGVKQAVEHIETYSSRHTEAIIATDPQVIQYFLNNVDSSSVMVNASTRLADGGVYGLGAEVGISTDKLHARGPMGVESLCSYKWILNGNGQIRE